MSTTHPNCSPALVAWSLDVIFTELIMLPIASAGEGIDPVLLETSSIAHVLFTAALGVA